MGYRRLELVIQSGLGLKCVNPDKDMKPYAVVFICNNNNNRISAEHKTGVDRRGDSNPTWNFNVMFHIDVGKAEQNRHALVVKLKSSRKVHKDDDIGEVRVPITELLEGFGDAADDEQKEMSKSVVTSDGSTEEGTLAFLYKFGSTVDHPPAAEGPSTTPRRRDKVKKTAIKVVGAAASAICIGAADELSSDLLNRGLFGTDDDVNNVAEAGYGHRNVRT